MRNFAGLEPQGEARIAGVLYLLNLLTGVAAMVLLARGMKAQGDLMNVAAGVLYTGVTVLLWDIFRPVSLPVSTVAAVASLLGCWFPLEKYTPTHTSNFVFFGVYCSLTAWLIFKSGLMAKFVGAAMACSGVCWLFKGYPPLYRALFPAVMGIGVAGEMVLIGYLLVQGLAGGRSTRRLHRGRMR